MFLSVSPSTTEFVKKFLKIQNRLFLLTNPYLVTALLCEKTSGKEATLSNEIQCHLLHCNKYERLFRLYFP